MSSPIRTRRTTGGSPNQVNSQSGILSDIFPYENRAKVNSKSPYNLKNDGKHNLTDYGFVLENFEKSEMCGEKYMQDVCPNVNCHEKIIFVIDCCDEMHCLPFQTSNGNQIGAWNALIGSVKIFIHEKSRVSKPEYAIFSLRSEAKQEQGFTTDKQAVLDTLTSLSKFKNDCDPCKNADFSSIFSSVSNTLNLPEVSDVAIISPSFIVRMIIVYARSYAGPSWDEHSTYMTLSESPYFFCDVVYMHLPEQEDSENNKCKEIESSLHLMNKGYSYILNVSGKIETVAQSFLKLTAHPLQRPHKL